MCEIHKYVFNLTSVIFLFSYRISMMSHYKFCYLYLFFLLFYRMYIFICKKRVDSKNNEIINNTICIRIIYIIRYVNKSFKLKKNNLYEQYF